MKNKKDVKTVGVGWHSGLNHSRDYNCAECGDNTLELKEGFLVTWRNHIVGFDYDMSVGIFRCPKCENLFWFHLNLSITGLITDVLS